MKIELTLDPDTYQRLRALADRCAARGLGLGRPADVATWAIHKLLNEADQTGRLRFLVVDLPPEIPLPASPPEVPGPLGSFPGGESWDTDRPQPTR